METKDSYGSTNDLNHLKYAPFSQNVSNEFRLSYFVYFSFEKKLN